MEKGGGYLPNHKRWIVGVMGSGSSGYPELSEPLGKWLAEEGFDLLTGGGGGVMEAVSRAFHGVTSRRGVVLGVIPGEVEGSGLYRSHPGYPNPWVELPIVTHLPLSGDRGQDAMSRNHINVLTSDVIVALPGGAGTLSEVELAFRYGRPIIAFFGEEDGIPGAPECLPIARELKTVTDFIRNRCRR